MNLTTFIVQLMKLLQKLKISADIAAKAVLAAGLVIVIASMFPRGESLELEFRVGAIWAQKDLIAPFSFPVLREEKEYQRDIDDAKRKVLQVFECDSTVNDRQARRLEDFFRHVGEVLSVDRRYRKELRHRRIRFFWPS
jgi:membrane-associated HD superfamily phosphohydrolase